MAVLYIVICLSSRPRLQPSLSSPTRLGAGKLEAHTAMFFPD
jgi:hypothetical protein